MGTKVVKAIIFDFHFKGINKKDEAFAKLKDFLKSNGMLEEIASFHTSDNGDCEVIYTHPEENSEALSSFAKKFFTLLKNDNSIQWVRVNYCNETEEIVINNMDYCKSNFLTEKIPGKGDMVYVIQR